MRLVKALCFSQSSHAIDYQSHCALLRDGEVELRVQGDQRKRAVWRKMVLDWTMLGECDEVSLIGMNAYISGLVRRMACCGNETNENVERHSIDRIDHLFCEFLSGVVYCDDPCHCCAPSLSTVSSVVECCSGDHHWLEHLWINSCNANLQSSVYNLPIRHATRME